MISRVVPCKNNLIKYSSVRKGLRYVCPDGTINLLGGDKIEEYARVTRKTPVLNPKTMGYVCPDGSINFLTEDAAQTFESPSY